MNRIVIKTDGSKTQGTFDNHIIFAHFWVIKNLNGNYYKDDNLRWTPFLEDATIYQDVTTANKIVCTLMKNECRIFEMKLVGDKETGKMYFTKEKITI